jgi:membrane protease YdiL (CAAX protease family)
VTSAPDGGAPAHAAAAGPDPARAHILPFAAWVLLLLLPAGAPPVRYALQSLAGLVALLWARPWVWYPRPRVQHLPLAGLLGAGVALLWVWPDAFGDACRSEVGAFYLRWAVRPLGTIPAPVLGSPYAPESCGWPLSLVRLAGSALVIAVVEEFFWRGFLYRLLVRREFLEADLGTIRWGALGAVSVVFGLEHGRWVAGVIAGLAYGLLYLRTRDLWATAFAHGVTNGLIGLHVLAHGAYGFW